jgi:signal transduction histidine kinase
MDEASVAFRGLSERANEAPPQSERNLLVAWGIPEAHASQRSRVSILGFIGLVLSFVALTSLPAVASALTTDRGTALAVSMAWLTCTVAATAAYHLTGLSRVYRALDLIESVGIQTGVCLFVYRSGNAASVFWLAYLGHAQLIASLGLCAQNLAVVTLGPCSLALFFWLRADPASAFISLLIGALGAFVYGATARLHSDLEASRAREAQLKDNLARFRVSEERSRIARDLHDSVGGELAALAWRLRRIALGPAGTTLDAAETEVSQLELRIRSVLESLRCVVLDLREQKYSWVDTLAALRERCQDLCGGRQLEFIVSGALDERLAERIAAELQAIIGELVRNATTHGKPRRVEVRIRIGDEIELSVSDDGTGIDRERANRSSGGLANIRARVTRLGGEFDLRSGNAGTLVKVRLPALTDDPELLSSASTN